MSSKSLPISSCDDHDSENGLRHMLSSLSMNLNPANISGLPVATWAIHGSKSMGENVGSSVKKLWDLGRAWVVSLKPAFVGQDGNNEDGKHVGEDII